MRALFVALWMLCPLLGIIPCQAEDPVQFFILICSYNNEKWCQQNLESVFCQTYPYWQIYYVDDCSTDGTGKIVEKYIQQRGFSDKCTVVHNPKNQKALANYYYAIKDCDPHKVVVNLDGDDWLAHPKVLEKLASIYKDPNIWLTYGSFCVYPHMNCGCSGKLPEDVIQNHRFRQHQFFLIHLRAYYAAIFQKIPVEDFLFKGKFLWCATDLAYMFPMIEMAANGHYKYIEEILYVYNYTNPISIFRTDREKQLEAEAFLRSKPPYRPLDKLF